MTDEKKVNEEVDEVEETGETEVGKRPLTFQSEPEIVPDESSEKEKFLGSLVPLIEEEAQIYSICVQAATGIITKHYEDHGISRMSDGGNAAYQSIPMNPSVYMVARDIYREVKNELRGDESGYEDDDS